MVRVSHQGSNLSLAWRIRDQLAGHPLLGGATARIVIVADGDRVILEGWTVDERVRRLAVQLAQRAAGRRAISVHLVCGHTPAVHMETTPLTQR